MNSKFRLQKNYVHKIVNMFLSVCFNKCFAHSFFQQFWEKAPGQNWEKVIDLTQGSYASGKCQGNLNFFKVRELLGNFMLCQGKMNFCYNVREMSGNFTISNLNQMMRNRKWQGQFSKHFR